jgi:hypothetical protein
MQHLTPSLFKRQSVRATTLACVASKETPTSEKRPGEPAFQVAVISRVSHSRGLLKGNSYGNIVCWVLSGFFKEDMKRTVALNRRVFPAAIMFLLVGVVALSTATRQPCLRACTGPWHTYKASHFTPSEQHESSVTPAAETADDVVAETQAAPPSYVPCEETLPVAITLVVHRHHFRSPPLPSTNLSCFVRG